VSEFIKSRDGFLPLSSGQINRRVAMGMLGAAMLPSSAFAQEYPDKPMRIIIPAGPGAVGDFLMRLVAEKLAAKWGQPVQPENKPGGNGIIGMQHTLQFPGDGYTLLMGYSGIAVANQFMYKDLPYNMERDFTPVSLVATFPLVLAISVDRNIDTLQQFLDQAKAEPDKFTYASIGSGTSSHLTMEGFQQATGIQVRQIPFTTPTAALTELLSGRIDLYFDSLTTLMRNLEKGRYKLLGIATKKRAPQVPDLATFQEQGVPDFESIGFFGVFVKSDTPAAITQKLSQDISALIREPETQERLIGMGLDPLAYESEEFRAFLKEQLDRWGTIIRKANITMSIK